MGIKVKIMLPYNPDAASGKGFGIPTPLPDVITFKEQKNEEEQEQPQRPRKIIEKIKNKYFHIN